MEKDRAYKQKKIVGYYTDWPITAQQGTKINLGCGFEKYDGYINVDAFPICQPDIVWDLNNMPWPFDDESVDGILANHVFEHLDDWWSALKECARILRGGGVFDMRVPDESSSSAGTYRDHKHIITMYSLFGVVDGVIRMDRGSNAWAASQKTLPLKVINMTLAPYKQYFWMVKYTPWLLNFCANHLRNFIHEQRFLFQKIGEKTNGGN